jgi:GntR family transcriptional regulator
LVDAMTRLPIQLSQVSGVPFYRQVVDQIADLLRTGALPPGFQLPSVRELAVQVRVSLITTRRAYADLEAAGLIVSKHGQGTFVADGAATASRRQSVEAARQQLAAAIHRAWLLGLRGSELRQFLNRLLDQEEDIHGI